MPMCAMPWLAILCYEAVEVNPIVVHGGGKAITRAMEKAGLKAKFLQGQRVTDEDTVKIVDEVLSRDQSEVVAAINSLGGAAKGFAGPDIFHCRKAKITAANGQPVDLGFVGEVTQVNTAALFECIQKGITPVISPTARAEDGQIYKLRSAMSPPPRLQSR